MVEDHTEFAIAMRGYDRTQVDQKLEKLNRQLNDARREVASLDQRAMMLAGELAEAQKRLREADKPSYAGLGSRIEQLLRSAEERFGPGEEATAAATRRFVSQVLEAAGDYLAPAVSQLAVAPLPVADHERMRSYCRGVVAAMVRVDLTRGLGQARAALQRMGEDDPGYAEAFRELMRLEQRRQNYTERD